MYYRANQEMKAKKFLASHKTYTKHSLQTWVWLRFCTIPVQVFTEYPFVPCLSSQVKFKLLPLSVFAQKKKKKVRKKPKTKHRTIDCNSLTTHPYPLSTNRITTFSKFAIFNTRSCFTCNFLKRTWIFTTTYTKKNIISSILPQYTVIFNVKAIHNIFLYAAIKIYMETQL